MHRLILIASFLLPFQPASGQTGETPLDRPLGLTPDQASQFLHNIEVIKGEFGSQKKNLSESALSRFRTAAASEAAAVEFYLACHKVVNIDRRPLVPGEKAPDPNDTKWREALIDSMRDTDTPAGLRLQCAYLALTLEAAAAEDKAPVIVKLREFLNQAMTEVAAHAAAVAAAEEDNGANNRKGARAQPRKAGGNRQSALHDLLQQPVHGTLFAKAYNLSNYVDKLEPWSYVPLDLDAQYERVILPHYTGTNRDQLPSVWDEFINLSSNLRKASMGESAFLAWAQTGYKTLLWRKWMDLLQRGVESQRAAQELVEMAKANPTHPNIRAWIEDLTKLAAAITGEPDKK